MTNLTYKEGGLSFDEAERLREKFGKNELAPEKKESFVLKLLHIVSEPMFLLLIAASLVYFLLGEHRDGLIMLVFVIGIIGIDVFQEWKTDKTLSALKDLSAPRIRVIRDGGEIEIASAELVPGDLFLLCEGIKIPADGYVLKCNDLCVDESTLTGESVPVCKCPAGISEDAEGYWKRDYCYAGTLVTQGTALILTDKTGAATEYGKISGDILNAPETKTPLQNQTGGLVKTSSILAAVLFVLVCIFTWFNLPDHIFKERLIESVLSGITLAMAMIPEEFPVILTVFLSMGAWRLARKNSLVRKLPSVETLGAVSVLCVDKTGTITMNRMTVSSTHTVKDEKSLCIAMGMACETDVYDPMEKAMLTYCEGLGINRDELFGGELIKEYTFSNELKMMGHVWRKDGSILVAVKGAPESVLSICDLNEIERSDALLKVEEMAGEGLRVIAVGIMRPKTVSEVPDDIRCCSIDFLGLVGLSDPPRESVAGDIALCNRAGIRVVMITGDSGDTALSIAKKIGMKSAGGVITGDMLNEMSDETLREKVKEVNIFSRVVPEHKMRIVKALKENGEIVAMTGDGVNDAPALKYADIGIAMGKRGSEVAREAADLILLDDNFSTIVSTVRDGRRIYDNIRKAVGYVFSIHIPIAFSSLLAPILGVSPPALLLMPLHVVLLELVIDPTCSVVLERQPAEHDIMDRPPRNPAQSLLSRGLFMKSILQGLVIFAASFLSYYMLLAKNGDAAAARSMGLAVIILSNVFLVQVNSSEKDFVFTSIKSLYKDKVMWAASLGNVFIVLLMLYTPLNAFLKLTPLSPAMFFEAILVAAVSVFWYELVKLIKKTLS